MELHWPHMNSGKHGAAGEGFPVGDSRTVTQILENNPEDDFECTYFRRRTNRTLSTAKKGTGFFPPSVSYTSASEFSEEYTDSDSESDNTSNVERWLESLPTNDAWSSTPNYSALDGSKGLEGVDEIQEDIRKIIDDDDSGTCTNSTNDSRKSLTSETEAPNVIATGDELAKRTFARRDKISSMAEWLERQAPGKRIRRALRTRKKIPLWTKLETDRINFADKEKSDFRSLVSAAASSRGRIGVQERNIFVDKTTWSKSGAFEGLTESHKATEKPSLEREGGDEKMREMVHRVLTDCETTCPKDGSTNDDKIKSPSIVGIKASKEFFTSDEPEETDDEIRVGSKRTASSSSTFKKLSPKLAKTMINGNRLSKRTRFVQETSILKIHSKRARRTTRGKDKSVEKPQLNSVQNSTRSLAKNEPRVSRKKVRFSGPQRTVRFQDEVVMQSPLEVWKQSAKVKTARNKKILQTVEKIVGNIGTGRSDCAKENVSTKFDEVKKLSSIPSSNKLQPNDGAKLIKSGSWKNNNRKRPMFSIENKVMDNKKPVFANPLVENCLDKSMEVALKKYKFTENTWKDFIREKAREKVSPFAYEPPAKKQKPKSFKSKQRKCPTYQQFFPIKLMAVNS